MKNNQPVTGKERRFRDTEELISTTDLKGQITSCNAAFIEVSGFELEELLGASHNIVRHPDMPAEAFADMWQHLKAGLPWMGLVKNRCKNGDHYWVDAYVTPIKSNRQVTGYESVRTVPSAARVQAAETLYEKIRSAGFKPDNYVLSFSPERLKPVAVFALTVLLGLGLTDTPWLNILLWVAVGGALATIVASVEFLSGSNSEAPYKDLASNPLLQQLYTGNTGAKSRGQLHGILLEAKARTVLGRMQHAANELIDHSNRTTQVSDQVNTDIERQRLNTETIATAMEEMSQSITEVADNANNASDTAQGLDAQADHGRTVLHEAANAVSSVDAVVGNASSVISQLEQDAETIGTVTTVIQSIAEQTNLLALNAAIEAARAGEQGRGFAVVADEVRSLASRTAESTQEIRNIIESLQVRAREAVSVMLEGKTRANAGVRHTQQVQEVLEDILLGIDRVKDMNTMIATAANEQSHVAQEITTNVHSVSDLGVHTAAAAGQTADASRDLHNLAEELQSMVVRFRE